MPTEYLRSDRHVYRCVAGEHLLIALHRESAEPMFAFTHTAAELWSALDRWTTADALATRLASHFDVSTSQALADVTEFIEQLRSIGAIQERALS
jgi:hypothetical protein